MATTKRQGLYIVHRTSYIVLASLFLILITCNLQSAVSYAENLSSAELIENAKSLDGKMVTYRGELVTAILNRGEYSWINLNDGDNAVGVWCNTSNLEPVKFIGDYKHKGDILEVEGIFNRACPVHGGELDIHADTIKIARSGFTIGEKVDKKKMYISIALFLITLSITIIFRKRT